MIEKALIRVAGIADTLLADLDTRDVALWIRDVPSQAATNGALLDFLRLPWRLILSDGYDPKVFGHLEGEESPTAPMVRKRGFVQVVDQDPSRLELPPRCLPVYLLNGRSTQADSASFAAQLRRMTMLDELRRSGARQLVVLSAALEPVPEELEALWSSGFRAHLTFISDNTGAGDAIRRWLDATPDVVVANLVSVPVDQVIGDVLKRYSEIYPDERRVLRLRDQAGNLNRVDVTEVDDPTRPILAAYSMIEERHLRPLLASELSEESFRGFFRDPDGSWTPYAAGLPWIRDSEAPQTLKRLLKKLDSGGSDENCIGYIASEPGAGGTTLARALAWECAAAGYPVLMAKPLPFAVDALPVVNFMKRVHDIASQARATGSQEIGSEESAAREAQEVSPRYETPWLVVFDSVHWQHRETELVSFRNELEKSGRPVCILLVTGTVLGLSFYNTSIFKKLGELSHSIGKEESLDLGTHLNSFLRHYGKQKSDAEWRRFYDEHTVRYLEGTAAFWVALSFWIQGQYDLTESIQEWMYRAFKSASPDLTIRTAILEIAAMSSVRLPLPESLLPLSSGQWPMSELLEDLRSSLGPLGLSRISMNSERHWALVHDILGRFLINAVFFDHPVRVELGFDKAKDAEHLRFLLLQQISRKSALGERYLKSLGEEFATTIFKIDPDHGYGSFVTLWREAMEALDEMPSSLRQNSRTFRHHSAISRRRIAALGDRFYGVTPADQLSLLNRAVEDLIYAIDMIGYTSGSESNLNLFNSLANAYFDLAKVEAKAGASQERLAELRRLASDATRRAFEENPTNSFVIETYVKNLLQSARYSQGPGSVDQCLEALGILFSVLTTKEGGYRASQLGSLADEALALLLAQSSEPGQVTEPTNPAGVLVNAWKLLSADGGRWSENGISQVSPAAQEKALAALAHPAGAGNMQVLRLSYDLVCLVHPHDVKKQLALVEQLHLSNYRLAPQLQLEYAILLFQAGRAPEGDKVFRRLREIWRESENFVYIPERLRWLRNADTGQLQTVHAVVGSDYGHRAMARVQEFRNALVPFRPEEHGLRDARPGTRLNCRVSFNHNGPFLRPVTAAPSGQEGR